MKSDSLWTWQPPITANGIPRPIRIRVARRFHTRLVGMLGASDWPEDLGLAFPQCGALHTWGMRFALDLLWLDADGTILSMHPQVGPWRLRWDRRAMLAIEFKAGFIQRHGLMPYQKMEFLK